MLSGVDMLPYFPLARPVAPISVAPASRFLTVYTRLMPVTIQKMLPLSLCLPQMTVHQSDLGAAVREHATAKEKITNINRGVRLAVNSESLL